MFKYVSIKHHAADGADLSNVNKEDRGNLKIYTFEFDLIFNALQSTTL